MGVFDPAQPDDNDSLPPSRSEQVWNALTFLLVAGIVVLLVFYGLIFSNPAVAFNPFPPPTMPVPLELPTGTPTVELPTPTTTVLPSLTATATETPLPPTITPTFIGGELGLTPTATIQEDAVYAFAVQGVPAAVNSEIFYPNRDNCSWLAVGGKVVDLQKRPVTGILVQLGGTANGRTYTPTTLTGTATNYGESGFEFTLSDTELFKTKGIFYIQLLDQQGMPLSGKVRFDTSEECGKNLVIINFIQVR